MPGTLSGRAAAALCSLHRPHLAVQACTSACNLSLTLLPVLNLCCYHCLRRTHPWAGTRQYNS